MKTKLFLWKELTIAIIYMVLHDKFVETILCQYQPLYMYVDDKAVKLKTTYGNYM